MEKIGIKSEIKDFILFGRVDGSSDIFLFSRYHNTVIRLDDQTTPISINYSKRILYIVALPGILDRQETDFMVFYDSKIPVIERVNSRDGKIIWRVQMNVPYRVFGYYVFSLYESDEKIIIWTQSSFNTDRYKVEISTFDGANIVSTLKETHWYDDKAVDYDIENNTILIIPGGEDQTSFWVDQDLKKVYTNEFVKGFQENFSLVAYDRFSKCCLCSDKNKKYFISTSINGDNITEWHIDCFLGKVIFSEGYLWNLVYNSDDPDFQITVYKIPWLTCDADTKPAKDI